MKMPKLYCAVLLIIATALPSVAFSQANVSRPRTGSPVIPGGSAIPGGQSVPLPGVADSLPVSLPGLEILDPADRERRAAVAASEAAAATEAATSDRGSSQMTDGRYGDLQNLIVSHLQINSLASIELNQFAAERTSASDVRDFAEVLVSDQQHFWHALERLENADPTLEVTPQSPAVVGNAAALSPRSIGPATSEAERSNPTQLGRTLPIERQIGQTPLGQTLPDQFPLSRRPPAQSLTPAADGGIRYGGTLPPAGGETRVPEGEVSDALLPPPITRQARPTMAGESMPPNRADQSGRSMNEWMTIADRSAQTHLSMAKELLSRNEGGQFDQRFVAMMLSERLRTLAQLRTVRDTGSDQFREIIQTAEELAQSHLVTAEALSSQLNER